MRRYACSSCGRPVDVPLDSPEILGWGEGGHMAFSIDERDQLMLVFVCPDCQQRIEDVREQLKRLGATSDDVEAAEACRVEPFGDGRAELHFGPKYGPFVCPPEEATERLEKLPDGAGPEAVRAA